MLLAARGVADGKAADKRLAAVLMRSEPGKLTASATDLYLAFTSTSAADVQLAINIAVPAAEMAERVGKLPDGSVELAVDAQCRVTVRSLSGSRRFTLPGMPGADMPAVPSVPEAPSRKLQAPASTLALLASRVAHSVSSDTTRAHVNSALLEYDARGIRMVSTDGHRLSFAEGSNACDSADSMLIPQRALGELRKLLERYASEQVTIVRGEAWVHICVAAGVLSHKQVSAEFPPYRQVIPHESACTPARVNRELLLDSVRSVAVAAEDKTGSVRLTMGGNAIRVQAASAALGDGLDEVPCVYGGPDVTVGGRAAYLADALACLDCDEVNVSAAHELDPIVVRPAAGAGYVGVIMPVRL